MNVTLPIVGSPSRVETAARCERRHVIQDVLCLRSEQADVAALVWGTAMHASAASWWQTHDKAEAQEAGQAVLREHAKKLNDRHSPDLLRLTVDYYTKHASPLGPTFADPSEFTLRACEERVSLEADTHTLSFQLDRLYVHASEPIGVLVDTKTAGRLDKRWHARWPMSVQQKLYARAVQDVYGVRLIGHYIEGVLKDVPSKLEYVAMPEWDRATLDEAYDMLVWHCQRDAELVARCMLPSGELDADALLHAAVTQTLHNPGDCFAYGVACPFLPVCTAPYAVRATLLRDGYVYEPPTFLE